MQTTVIPGMAGLLKTMKGGNKFGGLPVMTCADIHV